MATTTNYSWTTPDDTALVKDGAAAIRTLGSSIDTTTKNLNPSTTLGDIEYRSSTANTNTRLPIGTSGQILSVSGGVPAWTTPAAGGGNDFTLLNAGGTALTGAATVTISGISGKNTIMVHVEKASSSSSSKIFVRLNGDTTNTNYKKYGSGFDNTTSYAAGNTYAVNGSVTGEAWIDMGELGSANQMSGAIMIYGANTTNPKMFQAVAGVDGSNTKRYIVSGAYLGTSTISSIDVTAESGNLDAGTVFVYASNI
jgi:hypothetical protein